MSPLEEYKDLISQAEELERMAGPGNYGGPTYWSNREDSTRKALSDHEYQPQDDNIGQTWWLPKESCRAIYYAFDGKMRDALWVAAAKILREQAARLKERLEKQQLELQDTLRGLR